MRDDETTVNAVAGTLPKVTALAFVKPVPLMVTAVPPLGAPTVGVRLVTTGAPWRLTAVIFVPSGTKSRPPAAAGDVNRDGGVLSCLL